MDTHKIKLLFHLFANYVLESLDELVHQSNLKLSIGNERIFAPEHAEVYDYLGATLSLHNMKPLLNYYRKTLLFVKLIGTKSSYNFRNSSQVTNKNLMEKLKT